MFIQTESTPNPATLKFLPGPDRARGRNRRLSLARRGGHVAAGARASSRSTGVTGVFFGTDFVTVTKGEGVEWDHIKPAHPRRDHGAFPVRPPVHRGRGQRLGGHAAHDGPDAEIVNQIKELLDTRVRPAVAQDGGDITFHGFDRGVVYLHMQGACAGCPSSTLTLKMGIENLLRHYIPEVVEVRPVAA